MKYPWSRIGRRKVVGGATAIAVAVVATVGGFAAARPSIAIADDFGPGDGLNRFLVTLEGVAPTGGALSVTGQPAPSTPAPAPSTSLAAGGDSTGEPATDVRAGSGLERQALDIALLARAQAELGGGGSVQLVGSTAYYVTATAAMVISPGGDGAIVTVPAVPAAPTDAAAQQPGPASQPAPAPAPAPSAAPQPQPGQAPVVSDPAGDRAIAALADAAGIVSAQRAHDGLVLVATRLDADEVDALPGVSDVEESLQIPVAVATPDPMFAPYGWNLKNTGANAYSQDAKAGADVNAPAGWAVTQGQDTVVAVIDTGYDTDHPDMVGALWTNPSEACGGADTNGNGLAGDCHGWNFYSNSADLDNGTMGAHGTGVSGVIAARKDNGVGSSGVAPMTKIMPLVAGGGETIDATLAIKAIRYAADNGADVINASFGGYWTGSTLAALSSAVDYATAKGVVVVAAAGNDAKNRDTDLLYPASLPNAGVITVGSTNALDEASTTSAYGKTTVDLYAPGNRVFTTYNDGDYRLISGTSIAAPHVAAAAAMYRSVNPSSSVADVKSWILADAVPLASLTDKCVTGARLSVAKVRGAGAGYDGSLTYDFSGMVGAPGAQQPTVKVTSIASSGSYQVRLGLAMLVEGEVWAVAGEDVTVDGTTLTTDDTGQVTFPLGQLEFLGTRNVSPSLTLGKGKFGLTAQILKDGQPMSRPYAAPLLVGQPAAPAPGGTDPGTGGGTNPGGGTDPGTGSPTPGATPQPGSTPSPGTTPAPGTTPTPGGTDPDSGGGDDPSPAPGGGTNPSPAPGTDPAPGGGSDPSPAPGGGSDPSPAPGGGSDPSPAPGGGTNPTPAPGTTPTPGGTDPGPGTPDPTDDPAPGVRTRTYDQVGAFLVTSSTPVDVSTEGGQLVTIRGLALESGVGVRVGTTGVAHVVSATTTRVTFTTPKVVPGTYDVTVFKNGRTSVLPDALVYTAPGTAPAPGDTSPGPGDQDPPSGSTPSPSPGAPAPGTSPSPSPSPGAPKPGGTSPGGTSPGGTSPSPSPSAGPTPGPGGATPPSTPNATRTGPNGERLVRNDSLASLAHLWAVECSAGCTGLQA